jgi:mannose/fructose/N-acetylgalactosamine-specific phosphotransferase system component IID
MSLRFFFFFLEACSLVVHLSLGTAGGVIFILLFFICFNVGLVAAWWDWSNAWSTM